MTGRIKKSLPIVQPVWKKIGKLFVNSTSFHSHKGKYTNKIKYKGQRHMEIAFLFFLFVYMIDIPQNIPV